MNYAFHPEAKAELNEAVDYYRSIARNKRG